MQSKLIRYEWKAYKKPLGIITLILTITTILCCVLLATLPISHLNEQTDIISAFTLLGGLAFYYIIVIGCGLAATLLLGIRYYKSMHSDQAYLTHTLPVTSKDLLSSKVIIGSVFTFVCSLLILVSVMVVIPIFVSSMTTPEEGREIWFSIMGSYGVDSMSPASFLLLFGVLYLVMLIFSSISSTAMVYASVTLGQFYTKHRIIGAILCYLGIASIQSIICMIGYLPFYINMMITASADLSPNLGSFIGMLVTPSILAFILGVVLLFICKKQIDKNLNLE